MKKLLTFMLILLAFPAFCLDLSKENPSWVMVLGGNIISEPERTSYGYAVLCEGKQLFGYTPQGKVLWSHKLPKKTSPFITCLSGDILLCITGKNEMNLLNPGGLLLWSKKINFNIEDRPLNGRDGRFFVRGKNNIACYGITSVLRWQLDVKGQDLKLPLCELEDGSVLVFLNKKEDGKSIARRFSPFGEISEEIVFAGEVKYACSCEDGVLLSFSDGTAGLCSVSKTGETFSKWVIHQDELKTQLSPLIHPCLYGTKTAAALSSDGRTISFLNTSTGKIRIQEELTEPLDIKNIKGFYSTVQGFFACDRTKAFCITSEGKKEWEAEWKKSRNFTYVYATDSGYLSFCMPSWTVESFRMKQDLSGKKTSFIEAKPRHYKSFYSKNQRASNYITGEEISASMYEDYFNSVKNSKPLKDEKTLLSVLNSEAFQMLTDFSLDSWAKHDEMPYFTQNISYTVRVLNLMGESSLTVFAPFISQMMKKTKDPTLLLYLIKNAGSTSFDDEGKLLSAMDYLVRNVLDSKDEALLEAVCDSTCSICRFMGKPALFDMGNRILSYLLTSRFSKATNDCARKSLDRILSLKL